MSKKPNLDPLTLGKYRPISKISFLSKVLEKVIASQMIAYMGVNSIFDNFHYVFRALHSTETALIKLTNCLLDRFKGLVQGKEKMVRTAKIKPLFSYIFITGNNDVGPLGKLRTFLSYPHCRAALDLGTGKTYLIMGISRDIYRDERSQS